MSTQAEHSPDETRWIVPMLGRSPNEVHRASTPLELLFDLVFVVAVSQASGALHHGIATGHVLDSVIGFSTTFFAIWWAWVNFTWFASAYDTDDVVYRLMVFAQLTGALVLAAGVPQAFAGKFGIITAGYVVMRLAMVCQWLRAARSDPAHRATAHRYVIGITLVQIAWSVRLALPDGWQVPAFVLLMLAEIAVPVWAERTNMTQWHPGHIAERYGLFTLIVLGESILSASLAIQSVLQSGGLNGVLIAIIVGGLLIIFGMWWLYFDLPAEALLDSPQHTFVWGYGHLLIFAAAAAVGAGLAVAVDSATHHAEISATIANAAVALPVSVYLLCSWLLMLMYHPRAIGGVQLWLAPITVALLLLTIFTSYAVLLVGVLLVGLLTVKLLLRQPAANASAAHVPHA